MRYRQFSTDFWNDDYISGLSANEKNMFIFYFTNQRVNMCGIYEVSTRYAEFSTGLLKTEIQDIQKKFEADSKYFFYKSWVYIANHYKHSVYSSATNVINSLIREFNSIPTDVKAYFLEEKNLDYQPPIDKKKIKIEGYKEMVMVIDGNGNESRVHRRVGNNTDVIDTEQISKEIDEKIELENKLAEMSTN